MAERFQRLYALKPNLYSKGCPIIIEAGALQKDTESGTVLAQIKMRNIGEKTVASCKVSLKTYENNGDEVEGVSNFSYLDLNADSGDEFGTKVPIILPNKTTRSFTVDIDEVVFSVSVGLNQPLGGADEILNQMRSLIGRGHAHVFLRRKIEGCSVLC